MLQKILALTPKTECGAIDLSKADIIAEGGTHVLYRFKDAPFVIKRMKQNPSTKEMAKLADQYAILYDCFDKAGKARCIREQHIKHRILLPNKSAENAALSIVPYETCFNAKVKFDFKIEPTELDLFLVEQHQALFLKANKALIQQSEVKIDFNLNDYAFIDERIGSILKRLDTDPSLRETMTEFLTHYRDFYQKTNIILDAMGFENILFFKDEAGAWQFKVGSVIKHDTGKYTNKLFDAIHTGREVDLNGFVNFTHAYFSPANIRAVNVCAMKLGLPAVINDVSINASDLLKIPQKLSTLEQMLAYAKHGDFKKVDEILKENMDTLHYSLRDFWAYGQIADEYIKHGQAPIAYKKFLDTVSELPLKLPENREDTKRVEGAKESIISRKIMQNKKIVLHQSLQSSSLRPSNQSSASFEKTKLYKEKALEVRLRATGYMRPTKSSEAKKQEKYTPFYTTPKPPWAY